MFSKTCLCRYKSELIKRPTHRIAGIRVVVKFSKAADENPTQTQHHQSQKIMCVSAEAQYNCSQHSKWARSRRGCRSVGSSFTVARQPASHCTISRQSHRQASQSVKQSQCRRVVVAEYLTKLRYCNSAPSFVLCGGINITHQHHYRSLCENKPLLGHEKRNWFFRCE